MGRSAQIHRSRLAAASLASELENHLRKGGIANLLSEKLYRCDDGAAFTRWTTHFQKASIPHGQAVLAIEDREHSGIMVPERLGNRINDAIAQEVIARARSDQAEREREEARVRAAGAEGEAKVLREALAEARRPIWHRLFGLKRQAIGKWRKSS